MVVWFGAIGIAQMKITDAAEYAKVMQGAAQAFNAARTALPPSEWADAKVRLATAREGFVALQTFWTEQKREDAVGIVTGTLERIDALDRLLAVAAPSRADTLAVVSEIQADCAACHALYREGDFQSGFRFKAGMLPGF
jgi:cytochrome c556